MTTSTVLAKRRTFSVSRLQELQDRLESLPEIGNLPELCIYATGSYARNEASQHSDIDLFFLHAGSTENSSISRLDELRLFAKVIEIGESLDFPTFSNDGEFLRIHYLDDMLQMLGGREDDFRNTFTARMLLLLESKPLVNLPQYERIIAEIVDAYFRDYPDHSENFKALFLINDVIRFWKTLCLNYEHRRNRPEDKEVIKRKQQVKNFKLKFSRLMTCFGTITAICAVEPPIDSKAIIRIASELPLDRFKKAAEEVPEISNQIDEVLRDYDWFLGLTGLTKEKLHQRFTDREEKIALFERADKFGERVFLVLDHLAGQNDYRRFLVM